MLYRKNPKISDTQKFIVIILEVEQDDVSLNFVCLIVLRLNVPVNNFSVMSGRSHRFLGN